MKNIKLILGLFILFIFGVSFSGGAQNISCLEFAGNDHVYYADDATLDRLNSASDYTIEAWIYIPSWMDYQRIAHRYSHWDFYLRESGQLAFRVNGTGYVNYSADNAVPTNQWVHVAVIRSSSPNSIKFYVNGVDQSAGSYSGFSLPSASTNDNLYIGKYENGSSDYGFFNGRIDELRLKSVAINPANLHFHVGDAPYTSDGNTAALFHFDENSGQTTVNEASGINGTLGLNSNAGGDSADPSWGTVINLPLPIHLSTFHAQAHNKTVQLNWQTLSEVNNKGFYVQRSSDARNWEDIGFVAGMGDAHRTMDYSFTDKSPKNANYYRLKQEDFDDVSEFSDIEYVSFSNEKRVLVYPIPARDVVYYNTDQTIPFEEVLVYDFQGNLLSDLKIGEAEVDISSLGSGAYFLQFRSGHEVLVRRFIKE